MTGDSAALISVRGVSVRYAKRAVLDGVSFDVPAGTVFALLGCNGAGKTTLVRCLLGQQRPDEGSITVAGHDVWRDRAALMARVGVVPEEPDLPPDMTARQLVSFCGALAQRWNERLVTERLDRFAVPAGVPVKRLSKGQKAQLSLSLALGHEPSLLVLDDPTLGLDALARRAFFTEIVDELADRGITIAMTTHDLSAVERIATRVVILNGGKVVMDDDIETIKAAFRKYPDGTASLEDVFAAVVDAGQSAPARGAW